MKKINYFLYQVSLVVYSIYSLRIFRLIKNCKKESKNIILIWPSSFFDLINYFGRAFVLHDLAILYFFSQNNLQFSFKFKSDVGSLSNCNVFYSFSSLINKYNFDNHSIYLYNVMRLIEEQGNLLFPPVSDILFWENKVFMHQQFEKNNINSPKTFIIEKKNLSLNFDYSAFDFPFLIKEPFSNHSKGIYFINNSIEFEKQIKLSFNDVNAILIQDVVPMTKDARVVVVNNEVVYSYWRSKVISSKFTTTSTSNGSKLDFTPLNKKSQKILIDYSNRLGLTVAAFDVTFNNDDEESMPIVLEVSTSFLINPLPAERFISLPYAKFKSNPILFGIERSKAAFDFKLSTLSVYLNKLF
jgi:glutathione synthase/RimK-type ligase-like ATP-grasp enzyme